MLEITSLTPSWIRNTCIHISESGRMFLIPNRRISEGKRMDRQEHVLANVNIKWAKVLYLVRVLMDWASPRKSGVGRICAVFICPWTAAEPNFLIGPGKWL